MGKDFTYLSTLFETQVCLLTEQMSAKKGLKLFGKKGAQSVVTEMHQIHYHNVIKPTMANSLTRAEKRVALRYLMFLKQKRCRKIKARGCADGRKQRVYTLKEEASAPTVKTESVFLSSVIDAYEHRNVMTVDVPGAFMQADLEELVHMKFEGALAELLVKVDPKSYTKHITREKGKPIIYV